MINSRYSSISLVTLALLAACSSLSENATLDEAQRSYNSAQANPQVATLAPLELRDASDALVRARAAQTSREESRVVDNLAYVAKQKVAIAQETANRKNAEAKLKQAADERRQVQLQARTLEADQAKQQAAMAQQSSEEKSAALAAATAAAEQDRIRLANSNAEADAAKRQAANADANSAQDQARLQELQSQMDELQAKKTERGMVITLGDVLFDTGKAQLKSGGVRNVQKLADFLKKYPQRKVQIEGFTDSVGSNSANQRLSEQRGDAVRSALIAQGISSDRVNARGYGEAYPVASNDTQSGKQLNRRVEIVLSDESGNITQR